MVNALLYDDLDYVVGEPSVPSEPSPRVVVWGNEVFVFEKMSEDARPCYRWCAHYVITETRENAHF